MNNITYTAIFIKALNDKEGGYPQFHYNKIHVTANDFKIKDVASITTGRQYRPTAGDKIYLTTGCNIPRFKVKQFCQDHKVALVKYKERATAIFVGPESVEPLFRQGDGVRIVPKDMFLKFVDRVIGNSDPRYLPTIEDVKKSEFDSVFMEPSVYNIMQNKTFFGIKLCDGKDVAYSYMPHYINNEDNLKLFEVLCTDPKVYNQDDMLKLLNTAGPMTEDMYHSIKRLFESTDVQNTKLAMEAMANCDFEKSAVPLLLLIREFGKKIEESGNKHHVNFKSLCRFFSIQDVENVNLDLIINSLKAKKLLSPSNLKILMPEAMKQAAKDAKLKHFTVKAMDVSDEVKEALKENTIEEANVDIIDEPAEYEEINPNFAPDLNC